VKVFFQKIGAFVLATLILVATTSFSVSMHYCGTHLVSVSLNKTAKKCYKPIALNKISSFAASKKPCCHDTEFIKTGEDNLNKSEQASITLEKNFVLTLQPVFKYSLGTIYKTSENSLNTYHSPPIPINRQIFYQVFLI